MSGNGESTLSTSVSSSLDKFKTDVLSAVSVSCDMVVFWIQDSLVLDY